MADIAKLQTYARKLRSAGMSEPEIRRSVDQLEAQLETEAESEVERAPKGTTPRELAALNLERAIEGKPSVLPSEDDGSGERPDRHRDLSPKAIASMNFERALNGLAPLTADEIARESIRRANPVNHGEQGELAERAPKGMHPKKLAQENLRRACGGEPPLLPHDDNVPHDDNEE